MRNFGSVCVLVGVVGFFYCSDALGKAEPLPEGISISEGLKYPAGRFEVGQYAAAAVGGMGLLLFFLPGGRS